MNEKDLKLKVKTLLFYMTDALDKVNEDIKASKKHDDIIIADEHLSLFYQTFDQFSKAYTEYADEAGIDIPDFLRK